MRPRDSLSAAKAQKKSSGGQGEACGGPCWAGAADGLTQLTARPGHRTCDRRRASAAFEPATACLEVGLLRVAWIFPLPPENPASRVTVQPPRRLWLWYREAERLLDTLRSDPKRYRTSGQGGLAVLGPQPDLPSGVLRGRAAASPALIDQLFDLSEFLRG